VSDPNELYKRHATDRRGITFRVHAGGTRLYAVRWRNTRLSRGQDGTPLETQEQAEELQDALLAQVGRVRDSHHPGSPEERFFRYVGEPDENGCLPWLGRGRTGRSHEHGKFGLDSQRTVSAHRFAYEITVRPVPEGQHLHHECGNALCVNPEHLRPMIPEEHLQLHHGSDLRLDTHHYAGKVILSDREAGARLQPPPA